jgi:uncharacterized protein
MNKITLVLGASENPDRYSNKAIHMLLSHHHNVIPVGIKKGIVDGLEIITQPDYFKNIDTVTLYINPTLQEKWYDYILSLHPRRIIFNPGTENETFETIANAHGIETIEACTLVMLSTGQY